MPRHQEGRTKGRGQHQDPGKAITTRLGGVTKEGVAKYLYWNNTRMTNRPNKYHNNKKSTAEKELIGYQALITATKQPTNTEPKLPPDPGPTSDITHALDYTDLSKVA